MTLYNNTFQENYVKSGGGTKIFKYINYFLNVYFFLIFFKFVAISLINTELATINLLKFINNRSK